MLTFEGQRKLACTKEPEGCSRCKKENVNCNYSEQKTMGRPKKRHFIEKVVESHATNNYQDDTVQSYFVDDLFNRDGLPLLNPSYMVASNDGSLIPSTGMEDTRSLWNSFGDGEILGVPPIDFSNLNFETGDNSVPPLDSEPGLSSSVTDSENSPPGTGPPGPCGCLASMYLSLAALQQFPTDIVSALKTVRGAASTASNTIWCPQCGSVLLETDNHPIEAFQNTMLLGTILPVIAHGYNKLLKMIDDETEAAVATGQMKTFRFNDYGGMCGRSSGLTKSMGCGNKDIMINPIEMPPQQWRTTVRALLRVDIYGHEQHGFKHKGLKDLISEMEYRQRTRHEILDAQLAAGTIDVSMLGHGMGKFQGKCIGEASSGCHEILRIAKMAIDALVIA